MCFIGSEIEGITIGSIVPEVTKEKGSITGVVSPEMTATTRIAGVTRRAARCACAKTATEPLGAALKEALGAKLRRKWIGKEEAAEKEEESDENSKSEKSMSLSEASWFWRRYEAKIFNHKRSGQGTTKNDCCKVTKNTYVAGKIN